MVATAQQPRRSRLLPLKRDTVTGTPSREGSVTSRGAWQMRDLMSRQRARSPPMAAALVPVVVTRCHAACHRGLSRDLSLNEASRERSQR